MTSTTLSWPTSVRRKSMRSRSGVSTTVDRRLHGREGCRATDKTGPLGQQELDPLTDEEGRMEESMQPLSRGELPRREVMQSPDEVAAMLRLKGLGWGIKRIAKELGCSHMTSP